MHVFVPPVRSVRVLYQGQLQALDAMLPQPNNHLLILPLLPGQENRRPASSGGPYPISPRADTTSTIQWGKMPLHAATGGSNEEDPTVRIVLPRKCDPDVPYTWAPSRNPSDDQRNEHQPAMQGPFWDGYPCG